MNKKIIILTSLIIIIGVFIGWTYFSGGKPVDPNELDNIQVQSQVTAQGQNFSGLITGYDAGCFADGVCSVSVDDIRVILLQSNMVGEQPLGELRGVESLGDLDNRIGSKANVYAAQTESGDYTLYGDSDFFVEVE